MDDQRKRGRPKKVFDAQKVLTTKQRRAVTAEMGDHISLTLKKFTRSSNPFCYPAQRVAADAYVSKRSVEMWRKGNILYRDTVLENIVAVSSAHYTKHLAHYTEHIVARLAVRDEARAKKNAQPETGYSERGRWVKRNWEGPVISIIDGQKYENPDSYIEHMENERLVPYELVEALKAKK